VLRKWLSALTAALLVAALLAPAAVLASDSQPPDCPGDTFSTNEDASGNGQLQCNADSSITYALDGGGPTNGTLTTLDPDGSFTYDPDSNYFGPDSFDYTGTDEDGTSTPATIVITVTAVNDPPSFAKGPDDAVAENSGTRTVAGWATNISEGPANESSQTVTFEITGNTDASLFSTLPSVSATGTLTYKPATSQSGSATITLRLTDNGGSANGGNDTSPTQSFDITISGVNDPPSFTVGPDQTVLEDAAPQSVAGWATNISEGPPDESGQVVTFVIDSNTNPGLFSAGPAVNSSGRLTYTPAADANGSADITLHAHDSGGGTDDSPPQTFTINVTLVNDPPTFTKGANQTVAENAGAVSVPNWATSISKGPSNESGQTVTFQIASNSNPALFAAGPAISPAGTLTYTPAASANGSASIGVQLKDNGGTANGGDDTSGTQTFTITVTGVNDPPSFVKGANQTVAEDAGAQSIPNWATGISPGPSDEAGQTVTFVVDSDIPDLFSAGPAVSSSGTLTFTPSANLNGTSTITLHAHDNGGGLTDDSPTQTFTIKMTPVNDQPSFTKGSNQSVVEDSGLHTVTSWATNVVKGPADEAAQAVDFVIDSNSAPALFAVPPTVAPNGTLTYTLAPNANGSATIGLHIHDSGGGTPPNDDAGPTVTFTIAVSRANDAPTCANDSNATFVNTALNASLASCTDIDGDTLGFSLVTQSTHGTTAVNSNGTYTYTPNASFQGTDTFAFKANDGSVDSNPATMSILVSPDPIARNDVSPTDFPPIIQGSGPTAIPVLANDLDKQGGPLLITSVTQGSKGKVVITGGGTGLTYDPTGLATGTDSFRYSIVDNQSRTNSAIVVVIIFPDKTKPIVTVPLATIVSPATLGSSTGKVRISWSASDVGTGLKSVQLQESYNGATFKTVTLASPRASSVLRSLVFGKTYRYRVRATDVVGNVSTYVLSPTVVAIRYQESSAAIAYAGHWAAARSASYSGGKARWATGAGASATFKFSGRSVAWVSSKSATRGSAQVFVDGVLVRTVSLYRSGSLHRQVVFSMRWSIAGPHTIQVVNLRTVGHPRVDLDTLVIAR
jgi:large repetitive protein